MYSEIVFPQGLTAGNGASSSPASGAWAITIANTPVVPGSLNVTNGADTFLDDGKGNVTKAGVASGTINYATGAVSINSGTFVISTASTYVYEQFTVVYEGAVIAAPGQFLPNSPKPLALLLRNDGLANDFLVTQSEDNTNFNIVKSGVIEAYAQIDLGIVDMRILKVFASASARLQGQIVAAT